MKTSFHSKFLSWLLVAVTVFFTALTFVENTAAKDLSVQVVYDKSTFKIDGITYVDGIPKTVKGAHFVIFGRIYPAGTFTECLISGCGFQNGVAVNDAAHPVIGVQTCSGWITTKYLDAIFFAPDQSTAMAAIQNAVTYNFGIPYARTVQTFDFGATIDTEGEVHGNGKNMIVTDGYEIIPNAVEKSTLLTYRPITGSTGRFDGLTGVSYHQNLGFFVNGSGVVTANVVFHLSN